MQKTTDLMRQILRLLISRERERVRGGACSKDLLSALLKDTHTQAGTDMRHFNLCRVSLSLRERVRKRKRERA